MLIHEAIYETNMRYPYIARKSWVRLCTDNENGGVRVAPTNSPDRSYVISDANANRSAWCPLAADLIADDWIVLGIFGDEKTDKRWKKAMPKIMKIRKLRKAAGLSVQQLADLLGVYETEVNSWENEVYLPKARLLPAIAKVFGCTIDDLFEQEVV